MADLTAVTSVTNTFRTVFGNKRVVAGYVTLGDGSSTIPAAGLALTASTLGLSEVEFIIFEPKSAAYMYNYDNETLEAAGTGAGDGLVFNLNGGGIIPPEGEKVHFLAVGYGVG